MIFYEGRTEGHTEGQREGHTALHSGCTSPSMAAHTRCRTRSQTRYADTVHRHGAQSHSARHPVIPEGSRLLVQHDWTPSYQGSADRTGWVQRTDHHIRNGQTRVGGADRPSYQGWTEQIHQGGWVDRPSYQGGAERVGRPMQHRPFPYQVAMNP